MLLLDVWDVREEFVRKLKDQDFTSPRGQRTLEICGVNFYANAEAIFGQPNLDYIARETEWYDSQSLNVNDIPGTVPAIWKQCATPDGWINSNYGWMIYSETNGEQYRRTLEALRADLFTRRAIMIYTRPSMHDDWNQDGMTDFCCTSTVQYLVRGEKLDAIVTMRSNDAVFGYNNDFAWQREVLERLSSDLFVPAGSITWQAGSLHVYERHFYLVDNYMRTGKLHIDKADYKGKWQ